MKAAALVEYNAPDYVSYLKRVFAGSMAPRPWPRWSNGAAKKPSMAAPWGAGPRSPIPAFNLEDAFVRFRKGYTPVHFADDQ